MHRAWEVLSEWLKSTELCSLAPGWHIYMQVDGRTQVFMCISSSPLQLACLPLQPDFLASSLHLRLWQNPKKFWTENSLGLLALRGIVQALCRKRVSGDKCSGFNSGKSLDLVQKGMRDPQETKEGGRTLRNFQGGKNLGLCSPRAPQRELLQNVKGSWSRYIQYCLQIQIQKYLMQSEGKRLDQENLLFRVSNASLCHKGSQKPRAGKVVWRHRFEWPHFIHEKTEAQI